MIRTTSVMFWFGLVIVASLALYRTSDRVQELNRQYSNINAQIEAEQQSIHVLKAEWVYLASPSRVEALAKKHLSLRASAPAQIATMENLADMLPTHKEAMASVAITGTPIANVHRTFAALTPKPQATAVLHHKIAGITVASADSGHITDHMVIQRTASADTGADQIGSLLTQLDNHP